MPAIKFYDHEPIPMEMHKVKIVQQLNLLPAEQRLQKLKDAGFNTFQLHNGDIFMEKFGFSHEKAWEARGLFQERYIPIGVYESRPFPGMKDFLSALKDRGLTLAVATSKPLELAEQLLQSAGMRELFTVVRGSTLGGNNNSKQAVVESVIAALGAKKEDCVLIGDTKYDVAGAHAAGIACIGVRYGYAAPLELETAGADAIADDLAQLEKMLTAREVLV